MFETNIKKVKLVFLFPQKDWRKVIFVQKKESTFPAKPNSQSYDETWQIFLKSIYATTFWKKVRERRPVTKYLPITFI